jgi:hypothetical protein
MTFSVGDRLGSYEILAPIGAGVAQADGSESNFTSWKQKRK